MKKTRVRYQSQDTEKSLFVNINKASHHSPSITIAAPPINPNVISIPNTMVVRNEEMTTANVVAITFIIISEYLAKNEINFIIKLLT